MYLYIFNNIHTYKNTYVHACIYLSKQTYTKIHTHHHHQNKISCAMIGEVFGSIKTACFE